ncbi:hypothetical protein DK52_130 [Brucella abortus]|nr:hypothetical protein DK52_130 [Brucella abortus]
MLTLPERRIGFHIVHQKRSGLESGVSMSGRGDDENDIFAGFNQTIAVNDGQAVQRPAFQGLFAMREISACAMPG